MLVAGFPAGSLQANCYVLAPGKGAQCVIVDPGEQAMAGLAEAMETHDLRPAAVLCTHGHFDHVHDLAAVCERHQVPAYIRDEDRALLSDPGKGLSGELAGMLGGLQLREPEHVAAFPSDGALEVGGVAMEVLHTPGHTQGSVCFQLRTEEGGTVVLSGDTLFAGSVGRSDLPGGDGAQLIASIRQHLLDLDDQAVVLPGHGPTSTIGQERSENPFLR